MRIIAIVQARMGSTRLPGKVLLDLEGEPLLARNVNRLRRAKLLSGLVVATSTSPGDDKIVSFCAERGWECHRGSEMDVLDRFYQAALSHRAEAVVRICSDAPLIDPQVVDRVVEEFLKGQPGLDYASTHSIPPITYPRGLETEVMRFSALEKAWKEDRDPSLREHVTPYIYRNPDLFNVQGVRCEKDLSHYRWTVDTPEDFELASRIYKSFGNDRFGWEDVIRLMEKNPDWGALNQHVKQKTFWK